MKLKHYIFIIIILAVSAGSAVVLKSLNKKTNPYNDFRTFAQVLNIIKGRYVQPVDEQRLMEGAYRGAVESVFDQNSYIPETLMERLKSRQEEKGSLGLKVMKRSGYALVIYSDIESDVYKAGLEAGTVLNSINGKNTFDLSLFEIKSMLKGSPGSKVKLKFFSVDASEEIEKEFTYTTFKEKVCFEDNLVEMKVFSIHEFAEDTIAQFKNYSEKTTTPIVDLRFNQGKNYNSMLKFASFLTNKKMSAVFKDKKETVNFESKSDEHFNKKVIVLTSGFSMNAGAVMAELIKGNENIVIIGTKTSGKAFESTVLKLNTGGFVEIATGFYSPLTEKGLKPDIRSFIDNDEIEKAVNKYLKKLVEDGKKKEAA